MTTATKIRLSDGRYCYSGPNCSWHSPLGIAGIRKELSTAQKQITSASTLEEFTAAADKLKDASARYDATDEGLGILKKAIEDEPDTNERNSLRDRVRIAKARSAEVEAKSVNKKSANFVGFDWDNHTYEEPTFTTVDPESMYSSVKGSKFTGYRNVTEVAKDIREDLKKAQKDGYLPTDLKYRVNVDKFSGGQSVRVRVQGVKDAEHYTSEENAWGESAMKETYGAKKLNRRLKNIMDAYNNQSWHSEVDYVNVTYYSGVDIEDDRQAKWREAEAETRKKRQAGKNIVGRTVMDIKKAGGLDNFLRVAKYTPTHNLSKGDVKFGRIPNTEILVFEYDSYNGETRKEMYDFSASDPGKRTLEDFISQYDMRGIRRGFRTRHVEV